MHNLSDYAEDLMDLEPTPRVLSASLQHITVLFIH